MNQKHLGAKTNVVVFPENSLLGSKKNVRFNRESDFDFEVLYEPTAGQKTGTKIAKVHVSGLTESFKKYESTRNDVPIVKVQIDLTESGLLEVKNGVASFEIVVEEAKEEKKEKGSSWSLFGGGKKEEAKEDEGADDSADGNGDDKVDEESASESTADSSESGEKDKAEEKEKVKKTAGKKDVSCPFLEHYLYSSSFHL